MDGKVTYWIEMSDYDLETADAMLLTGRYLYVGFMCHQTIEKIELSEEQLDFIDTLEPLNIEARYPSYKERLMKSLTKEYCIGLLSQTKELQSWIKNKL